MEAKIFEEVMVFFGLMATLGCTMKIVLTLIHRRQPTLKAGGMPVLEEVAARLTRIEQAVEATAIEVERISEAQRFTTKLLVEKGLPSSLESTRARAITPH